MEKFQIYVIPISALRIYCSHFQKGPFPKSISSRNDPIWIYSSRIRKRNFVVKRFFALEGRQKMIRIDKRNVFFPSTRVSRNVVQSRRNVDARRAGRSHNCDLDRWKAVGRTMESAFDCITSIICRKRRGVSRVRERHAQAPYQKSRGSAASGFIWNGNGIRSVQRSHHWQSVYGDSLCPDIAYIG